eukprot:2576566-Pyramimonas_sp.AAC.2
MVTGDRSTNPAPPLRIGAAQLDSQSAIGAETPGRLHLTKLPPLGVGNTRVLDVCAPRVLYNTP